MRRFEALATALTVAAWASPVLAGGQGSTSEPYFGIVGQRCAVPDTTPDQGPFLPGVAHPSPPRAQDQALVQAFVDASVRNDRGRLRRLSSSSWLRNPVAESCISAIRALSVACRAERLYLLGDGEIRQSWACGNQVPYQLFFTIVDGRISNIWAMDRHNALPVVRVRGA